MDALKWIRTKDRRPTGSWVDVAGFEGEINRRFVRRDVGFVSRLALRHGALWFPEIFGRPWEWFTKRGDVDTELALDTLNPLGRGRTPAWAVWYAARIWTPKVPWTGPGLFEQRPVALSTVVRWCDEVSEPDDELWIFVNGILNDEEIARVGGRRLSALFDRPIHVLLNPTAGLFPDLWECIEGRTLDDPAPPALALAVMVHRALQAGVERVVVVGHSQGTILASNAVEHLIDLGWDPVDLAKVELALFGSCVDHVPAHPDDAGVPYVEHYVNSHDLVARLGPMTQPPTGPTPARGPVFRRDGQWGHLLNLHYLDGFADGAYQGPGKAMGRLFGRLAGR